MLQCTKNDSFHDIAIHCYINLPGYNTPPEAMHSETHVVKSNNGENKKLMVILQMKNTLNIFML